MAAQPRQMRPPLLSHTILIRETAPYIVINLFHYVQYYTMFCLVFVWCPCMAINVSVQYNGGLLPDIILLTQCYYHRGTRLNATQRFRICGL